jgi:hypothetical protein
MRNTKRTMMIFTIIGLGIVGWLVFGSGEMTTVSGLTTQPPAQVVVPASDLTAGALPHVRHTGRDPVEKAAVYEVRVKNMTTGPVRTKSLVLVVDHVTDNRSGEEVGDRVDVLNADGHTDDGKSFYRVEADQGAWLAPAEKARPIQVKLREHDKIHFFTPSFRVREVPAEG